MNDDDTTRLPEERALTEAARAYFAAIGVCEQAGGQSQRAILEAMPDELREQLPPMLSALGMI